MLSLGFFRRCLNALIGSVFRSIKKMKRMKFFFNNVERFICELLFRFKIALFLINAILGTYHAENFKEKEKLKWLTCIAKRFCQLSPAS